MRKAFIPLLVASSALFLGSAAFAGDVVIDHPAVVPPPEHHEVVVEHHDHDCHSTTVHKENDAGESKTVHRTDCD